MSELTKVNKGEPEREATARLYCLKLPKAMIQKRAFYGCRVTAHLCDVFSCSSVRVSRARSSAL